MYSAPPNGADSATINPAALNPGQSMSYCARSRRPSVIAPRVRARDSLPHTNTHIHTPTPTPTYRHTHTHKVACQWPRLSLSQDRLGAPQRPAARLLLTSSPQLITLRRALVASREVGRPTTSQNPGQTPLVMTVCRDWLCVAQHQGQYTPSRYVLAPCNAAAHGLHADSLALRTQATSRESEEDR